MSRKPVIFQVAGFSNSGKTTMISKWTEMLRAAGKRVAVIKHHGHAEKRLLPVDCGKDSAVHRSAGAVSTFVSSRAEMQWQMELVEPVTLQQILSLHDVFSVDIVLIEGYKQESYPKLLLLRNECDLPLVGNCSNVEAIVCWRQEEVPVLQAEVSIPVFHLSEEGKYLDWLIKRVTEQEGM
ncbi:molybdopterin-guanine dinucleotide biosynthesis protein B [Evansella caseinilytica]|uniref:Molybdopterin-guanine dinucleotide biosynthesis protein B n=1 Tax=Evansella caseinilytica TaxID=1503961 RepID=A0A1H3PLX5_9BACI|nr:molybdopterin-guanine dinucleotide biosynthesis protein B [Evansella caseinilytica]SDZ01940.1 molybdopterin-guanine dinucleotide biosynthesis protein B [Evansella caseinilytica]